MIDLLKQLIATPSFSREEGPAADLLEAWMRGQGLPVQRLGNNLWCETPGTTEKTLLLNAHIDTVKPSSGYTRDPFCPTLEGDTLYGLGSNDDGGSLVALLATYRELSAKPQPYRLIFSATAEEEICGKGGGLDLLLPELGKVDLGIIGEPTKMQMAVSETGLMVLDCTAHGVSGHAAREEGVNALYKAMEDIEWLRSQPLDQVKLSVTMISAGTQHNVVPDTCTFVVDVRSKGRYSNLEVLERVKAGLKSDVKERSTHINASFIPQTHPVVQRGLALGLTCFNSPTTSNQALCPFTTLKIGPGDSARSHTADEYIRISEIEAGIKTYVALLDGLAL